MDDEMRCGGVLEGWRYDVEFVPKRAAPHPDPTPRPFSTTNFKWNYLTKAPSWCGYLNPKNIYLYKPDIHLMNSKIVISNKSKNDFVWHKFCNCWEDLSELFSSLSMFYIWSTYVFKKYHSICQIFFFNSKEKKRKEKKVIEIRLTAGTGISRTGPVLSRSQMGFFMG